MQNIIEATHNHLPEIREIWEDKFPAENGYNSTVFEKIIPHCINYVYIIEYKIVSILSIMPIKFINKNANIALNGWYLFGVATRNGYEGQGLASKLIRATVENLKSNGYDFIFERPANQALNNFYLKLGFTISVRKQKHLFITDFTDKNSNNISAKTESTNTKSLKETILNSIRNRFNSRFEWSDEDILDGLIELGEIERHNELQTESSLNEDTYIAVNPLKQLPEELFQGAFFCFPME